jgi:hypothetical protein
MLGRSQDHTRGCDKFAELLWGTFPTTQNNQHKQIAVATADSFSDEHSPGPAGRLRTAAKDGPGFVVVPIMKNK